MTELDEIKDMLDLATTVEKIGKVADFTELTPKNLKKITNAIKVVNEFNSKITTYGERIFRTLFLDSEEGWCSRLSEKDVKRAFGSKTQRRDREKWGSYVLCYKTMTPYRYNEYGGWVMGASTGINERQYHFQDNILIVVEKWKTQQARFNHVPWISRQRTWTINLETKEVNLSGDDINGYGR